jgi:hypothetical protein
MSKLNKTALKTIVENTPPGLWIWRLAKLRHDYLDALKTVGCKRVYLKVFDDLSGANFWDFQCTPAIVGAFNEAGISVVGWGYHFDKPKDNEIDVPAEIEAVRKAMDCGLDGYIFDLEEEIKSSATHAQLAQLLEGVRDVTDDKFVGYTSFGHPGKHGEIPWKLLDSRCDLAFPQIYFEKWTFGGSDEKEVQSALKAHEDLGLAAPILPLWGSEEDTQNPASASTLQSYLNRFPGSSIFRAPNVGQQGKAWKLNYASGAAPIFSFQPKPQDYVLPEFVSEISEGGKGKAVELVQRALAAHGFDPGPIDGKFGPMTKHAVIRYQTQNDLTPDGVVGPKTWTALGGQLPSKPAGIENLTFASSDRDHLAAVAEVEGAKGLSWKDSSSEAEKYLKPLRKPMQDIGDIGSAPVFFNWCAAFVTWCARQAGYTIPDQPPGHGSTMALVEMWKAWAKDNGWWHSKTSITPMRGDILCFEWNDGDSSLDHIGIVRFYSPGSATIETAEGNRNNKTVNGTRNISAIGGIVRLP